MAQVTRGQALSWTERRQLLEPVGASSAEDVVAGDRRSRAVRRRAAIRTRQRTSRPGEVAVAVADGRILRTSRRGAGSSSHRSEGGACLARVAPVGSASCRLAAALTGGVPVRPALREAVRTALDARPRPRTSSAPSSPAILGSSTASDPRDGPVTLLKALAWQGDLTFGPSRDGSRRARPCPATRAGRAPAAGRRRSARRRGAPARVRSCDARSPQYGSVQD